MRIYEYDPAIEALLSPHVDAETGEIVWDEVDMERIQALKMEKESKIESLGCAVKDFDGDIAKLDLEIQNLKHRKEVLTKEKQRAMQYLEFVTNGEPFESARCSVSYRKSEKVEISDPDATGRWLVSNGYYNAVSYEEVYKPVKKEIKSLINSGVKIEGAQIIKSKNMEVN